MKNLFLKSIPLFFALFFVKHSTAQKSMTFDAGQMFSTFKFVDSTGTKGNNYSNDGGAFAYNFGYRCIIKNGFFINSNIGFRNAKISLVDEGRKVGWNLQYADASVGLGYILNKNRLQPYFSAAPYLGYLFNAKQTINGETFDIRNKYFKSADFGFIFSPGLKGVLNDYVSIFAEYKYLLGLSNIEKTAEQKTFNRNYSFNIGLSFNIAKNSKSQTQPSHTGEQNLYKRNQQTDDALRHLRNIINK